MAEALRRLTTPALAFGWNLGLFSFSYLTANNITSLPQFLTSKMGIILSLITYSRKTKHKAIEEVADFLMNQVLNNMTNISPLSFSNGLTGIGWGIEYLIQNRYMPGCGADICTEIDKKLMSCDIRRVDDLSLEHGIYGWLHYIVAHIQGANRCGKQVFDRMYIIDLISKINEYLRKI